MEAIVHTQAFIGTSPALGHVRLYASQSRAALSWEWKLATAQEAINQAYSHKSTITGPFTLFQIPSAQQMHWLERKTEHRGDQIIQP